MNFLKNLENFIEYCNSFYNIETGIYPLATKEQIIDAIGQYMTAPHKIPIEFDSLDREKVRTILQPTYTIF